jgi:hypothetical protein
MIAGANWLLFLWAMNVVGGSAVKGKLEGGNYYLRQRMQYTRVDRFTFEFLWWYEKASMYVLFGGFIAGFVVLPVVARPRE